MKINNFKLSSKMAAKPLLLGAVLFFIINIASCNRGKTQDNIAENTDGIAKYQYFEDEAMWTHIFDSTKAFVIPENVSPKAMIIPHHDITTGNQNSFYKAVSQQIQPSVIVIVAPDHFELGEKLITMPDSTVFMAPDGNININYDLISKIAQAEDIKDAVSLQSNLWFQEHGIFIHTPFLKHYFPDATVVPILAKMLTTDDEFEYFEKLGKTLAELLPEDSLVIASVDFSHYQTPKMTELHDIVAMNTIQKMEDPRFAEIDSPESIQTILKYCEAEDAVNPVLINRSSTFDYIPDENVESTSHQYWCFYDDDYNSDVTIELSFMVKVKETNQRTDRTFGFGKHQTVLIGGSGKTDGGIRETWKWDRYKTSTDPAEILLRNAAGKEARFFYGFDAIILDPEIESTYSRTLHNTTLTVETISQNDFENNFGLKVFRSVVDTVATSITRLVDCKALTYNVNILEVILNSDKDIDEEKIKNGLLHYDVIVFRDNEGKIDAKAYLYDSLNQFCEYNLGIIHGEGNIKGSLLAVDFNMSGKTIVQFDYESSDGIIPAINQFIPDDYE